MKKLALMVRTGPVVVGDVSRRPVNLGPTELVIILVIGAVLIVPIVGGIDAATKPGVVWQRAGENQMLWVLGQLLGAFFCGVVGLVFALIYFTQIRPKVLAARSP